MPHNYRNQSKGSTMYANGGSLAFTGTGVMIAGQSIGSGMLTGIGVVALSVGAGLAFTARIIRRGR